VTTVDELAGAPAAKGLTPDAKAALEHARAMMKSLPRPVPAKVHPERTKSFYNSWQWKRLRYALLKQHGRRCQCCGADAADGAKMSSTTSGRFASFGICGLIRRTCKSFATTAIWEKAIATSRTGASRGSPQWSRPRTVTAPVASEAISRTNGPRTVHRPVPLSNW
jgi:hypothetical protein